MRFVVTVCITQLLSMPAFAQLLQLDELSSAEIRDLDRSKTVVLLPGGILEEHGPYLPTFTDGFLNQRLTTELSAAITAREGLKALVFPIIPLGNSGANDIGAKYSFPGTFALRFETLRSVYMDLADEIGAQGFRMVFVLHIHGAPNHSRALDDAGDYFHDVYGGWMVHLGGLLPVFDSIVGSKSDADAAQDGLPIHSGMDETSWLLFLRPDLVRDGYRMAPTLADASMEGIVELASAPDWPGYFGAPELASSAHGAAIWENLKRNTLEAALSILDGADPRTMPRFGDAMEKSEVDVRLDAASLQAESERALRQAQWLKRRDQR